MAPGLLAKLFQTFEQAGSTASRNYGVTGLGPANRRRFGQRMGGDMAVTSEAGRDSTLMVTLPEVVSGPAVGAGS